MVKLKKKNENTFYNDFKIFASKIVSVAEAFSDMVSNYENIEEKAANIKAMETECDQECHRILHSLRESSVTPFDREDVYEITKEMDEIVDAMEEAASRFKLFNIREMRHEAVELADLLLAATRELKVLFEHLEEFKKSSIVMDQIIEVNRIENEGDVVHRNAISDLFREEKDPIEVIKWEHIFEMLEDSIDSCETIANMLEGVVAKYA